MFPKQQIDGFEKYWRRRKPGSSTAVHYSSDMRIFFKWALGQSPESITVHVRVSGKGQREWVVYLSTTASQLLSEYLTARPAVSGELVFINWRGSQSQKQVFNCN